MLCHRNLGGIDLLRTRCLNRAISGINGNTAASIAMTASRFSSNLCQRVTSDDLPLILCLKSPPRLISFKPSPIEVA
jgi:hypothetical protein